MNANMSLRQVFHERKSTELRERRKRQSKAISRGGKQNSLVLKSIPSDRSSLSISNSRATNSTNQNKMEEK